jgi:tetratricopeptide (TPR) repeat protein
MVKKQDKTEENIVKVEEALSNTEKFIEKNQRLLSIIVGAIVVLVLIFFAFKKFYVAPRETEAQNQMFMAEKYFGMDSLDLALNGDGMYPGFLQILDNYRITKAANLARYYTGMIYLHKGEFENAIEYLKKYKGRDDIIGPMAKGGIGDAYLELNNQDKAVSYYMNAAEMKTNDFTSPMFFMKAGSTYELMGKYEDALKLYEKIKKEFPKSNEAREIDKYIARAKGLNSKS